jgi:mannose-6-phosphate isomerase-like protein (cupin superfamily)
MQPFIADLERLAEENDDFRRVLYTGPHTQVVTMLLKANEEIGLERHTVDQVFLIAEGVAEFEVEGMRYEAEEDAIVVVPAGARHNVTNIGSDELRLITIYAPAQHHAGTVHHTKAAAMAAEAAEHLVPA